MRTKIELTGQRFDRLIVINFSHMDKNAYWKCKCDCGKFRIVAGTLLKNGKIVSCGCTRSERRRTHGMGHTRFYNIHNSMKGRCCNKSNQAFHNYGGRGIKLCSRWLKFENFRDDMLENYLEHCRVYGENNTSIERINNNGGYSPTNCCFETRQNQANNTRTNHLLTFNEQTATMSQWAKKININIYTLYTRINTYKWSVERALTTPTRKINFHN